MEGTGQDSDGKEVSGEFVVARGDAEPIFDAAQVVSILLLPSIETLGTVGRLGGVAASGDDGWSAFICWLPVKHDHYDFLGKL
jgi:hypothetical protein